jgi:hypothetical protein
MNRVLQPSDSASEWCLLQNQFDSYEKYALLIKLAGVVVLSSAVLLDRAGFMTACILTVLWLQDAIWKTFQSRIETRLLRLEVLLAGDPATAGTRPYQFNREFSQRRAGVTELLREYLRQALRPTVAFPHVVLIGLVAGLWLTQAAG